MEDNMSKTCDGCKNKVYTEEEKMLTVPYVVHQSAAARQERQIRRMWIVVLVLIGALIGTNIAWVVYENSFEDVVTTTEEHYDVKQNADGGGDNNSVINGGVVNGEAENQVYEENDNQNP
jgi:hypothetical protein